MTQPDASHDLEPAYGDVFDPETETDCIKTEFVCPHGTFTIQLANFDDGVFLNVADLPKPSGYSPSLLTRLTGSTPLIDTLQPYTELNPLVETVSQSVSLGFTYRTNLSVEFECETTDSETLVAHTVTAAEALDATHVEAIDHQNLRPDYWWLPSFLRPS